MEDNKIRKIVGAAFVKELQKETVRAFVAEARARAEDEGGVGRGEMPKDAAAFCVLFAKHIVEIHDDIMKMKKCRGPARKKVVRVKYTGAKLAEARERANRARLIWSAKAAMRREDARKKEVGGG